MATFTTDLVTLDAAGAGTTWVEPTATGWTDLGTITQGETDAFIQGSNCVSGAMKSGLAGIMTPALTAQTIPTDGAVLIWFKYDHPNSLSSEATGGIRTIIGDGTATFRAWTQGGSDTYTYGGWINLATSNTLAADYTAGAPGSTLTRFGVAANTSYGGTPKGSPFMVDAVRIGRCQITATGADCDFTNMAANNDAQANRWGIFAAVAGGFLWKGLLSFGNSTTSCTFSDSNKAITIDNTKKVTSAFNKIEVSNNSTSVTWSAVSITSLSTVSRGNFQVVSPSATLALSTCTFTGMGTFDFRGSSTVTGTTFRRCLTVSANSSNLQSSIFTNYQGASNTSALQWGDNVDTNGKLDGCQFVHGTGANNCHGLELANQSLTSITLTNVTFSGYNGTDGQPNSAIHVKKTTGSLTINITGGTTPSYLTEGATVTIVSGSVDVTVTVSNTSAVVQNARVFLRASDGTGPFPYQESVTITNSGTTATVAHTGHGMATNDKVVINGASHWQNNGVFTITVTNANEYTYTLPNAPGSNPTGTITSTFVALEGLTDSSGVITTSRVYPTDQPVTGWVRKSSSAPYYKTSQIAGSVDSSGGFSASTILILDS